MDIQNRYFEVVQLKSSLRSPPKAPPLDFLHYLQITYSLACWYQIILTKICNTQLSQPNTQGYPHFASPKLIVNELGGFRLNVGHPNLEGA